MNDRELLELAARAAGVGYTWSEFWETMARPLNDGSGWDNRATWNPLKDDGDALRLAVKRGLVVTPDRENQRTLVSNQAGMSGSEDLRLYDSRPAPYLRGMAGKRRRSVGGCSGSARTLDGRDD